MNCSKLVSRCSIMLLLLSCYGATGANLQVTVLNQQQQPIEYAVVYINEKLPMSSSNAKMIDQVDKEFIPYVTAIQRGSSINFPNNDNIRHQVYSFSKTKAFEIPLYSGNPLRPVLFDKAGVVAMACNIHDWMSAYIYVLDTDKFVVTDKDGHGVISNLPNGEFDVLVWHPKLKAETTATAQKIVLANTNKTLTFTLAQKPVLKAWRAPKSADRRGY
jgi:plastocyanin